jgi:ATP-dependent DNA helicase RecG
MPATSLNGCSGSWRHDILLLPINQFFGAKFSRFTKLEVQALVTADLERTVDNARLRQITGGHAADMTKLLQTLVAKGALTQEGQGRWTRYRLPELLHSLPSETDSLSKDGHSLHNDELLAIAAPAHNQQRLPPKEMEKILLELCRERWLNRNEISALVHRNPESLRQRYINPMVEHGLLRLRYPEKPNRTDQAYTTVLEDV